MTSAQLKYDQLIEDLRSDFRPQREWSEGRGLFLIIGHFLVGVAGGAWIFGYIFDYPPSLVCSFILAAGGGLSHLVNLGRPERFWQMMRGVRKSWVARGFWGLTLFLGGGGLLLVAYLLPGNAGASHPYLARTGEAVAWLGAVVMIGYMGFAYMVSKAIPFWNSSLHPVLYIAYALRGGAGLIFLLAPAFGMNSRLASGLLPSWIGISSLVVALWAVEAVSIASSGDEAARRSMRELFRGSLVGYLYVGVLFIGLVVPAILVSNVSPLQPSLTLAFIGLTSIVGDLFIKLCSVKAGIHVPIRI